MSSALISTNEKAPSSRLLLGFVAGFIATLVFHQAVLTILHEIEFTPAAPFPLRPTRPFGIPQIWSLAFWGGIWGLFFAAIDRYFPRGAGYWLVALIFGAVAPSLVAWLVVFPMKGLPAAGGWKLAGLATGLMVNGAWGIGTALLLRGFSGRPRS